MSTAIGIGVILEIIVCKHRRLKFLSNSKAQYTLKLLLSPSSHGCVDYEWCHVMSAGNKHYLSVVGTPTMINNWFIDGNQARQRPRRCQQHINAERVCINMCYPCTPRQRQSVWFCLKLSQYCCPVSCSLFLLLFWSFYFVSCLVLCFILFLHVKLSFLCVFRLTFQSLLFFFFWRYKMLTIWS